MSSKDLVLGGVHDPRDLVLSGVHDPRDLVQVRKSNIFFDLPNILILEVIKYLHLYDVRKMMSAINNRVLFKLYKDLLNGTTISFGPDIMDVCTSLFSNFMYTSGIKVRDWPESKEVSFAFYLIDNYYYRSRAYLALFKSILDNPKKYIDLRLGDSTLLTRACLNNNIDIVKYLFEIGVDFQKFYNLSDFYPSSDLQISLESVSRLGFIDILEYILSVYPDTMKCTKYMVEACNYNRMMTVRFLISKGWSINHDYFKTYPLLVAIRNRNIQLLKLLLESGANVNIEYENPLCLACAQACNQNDLIIIDLLLQYGAKKNSLKHLPSPYELLIESAKKFDDSDPLYQKIKKHLFTPPYHSMRHLFSFSF